MICHRRLIRLYSSDGFKELWAWTFLYTSWTLQQVSEGVLFFQIVGRFHRWSLYWRKLGKGLQLKNYRPVSLFSVVSKVFEKLGSSRNVDHLQKCGLFSDFQYGFKSSRSIPDLLTVVSDRIARACDRVWHAGLLHKLRSMGFQVRYLALFLFFSVIDGFKWFWIRSLQKNIQLMLEFLKVSFLVLHFS